MTDKTFTPRKLINIHTHIRCGDDVDRKVAVWKKEGAIRTCVLCTSLSPGDPGWGVMSNEDLQPWLAKYPDHLIGFAGLNLALPDLPSAVDDLHARGFRGFKCIRPNRPYDDDSYMPLYEAAARRRMPILFHTGSLSYPPGYRGPCTIDFMRPARLERIARYFPELPVIGAHLGLPWGHEAVGLALSRPNLYFDISGGSGAPLHGSHMKKALSSFEGADPADPEQHYALKLFRTKLLFGTDNPPVSRWVPRAEDIMDHLRIPADAREEFYWKTSAKLLGIAV